MTLWKIKDGILSLQLLVFLCGLDQDRCCECDVWAHLYDRKPEFADTEREKESRKYNRCGEISPGGQSQATEIVKEIPQGEPVKLFQLGDSFGFQYSLQMLGWKSFYEHENFDLGEFNARDPFFRYMMVIGHAPPPHSSDGPEDSD